MTTAKELRVVPIDRNDANRLIKKVHYSGSIVNNSQVHLGVFIGCTLEGAMQFGPSMDKRKIRTLVRDTAWNGFIELNRLAFSERLPRNSESRAIGVAMRLFRKHYPHIEWVISFADGAQCGDGTIYRASGFLLTGIRRNNQMWMAPGGQEVFSRMSLTDNSSLRVQERAKGIVSRMTVTKSEGARRAGGGATMRPYVDAGWEPIPGFQLRYIYFLNPEAIDRLSVPVLPFCKIDEIGAGMYRGEKRRAKQAMAVPTAQRRGSADLHAPTAEKTT